MSWLLADAPDQTGKTILVTGANTGIGLATARLLMAKGAHVILACRNLQKGAQAQAALRADHPAATSELAELDLADLASVRACAAAIAAWHPQLDVLINNAGLMMPPLQRTKDGLEIQFGTNVIGHFALTLLLLPQILNAQAGRVVWLSSVAHTRGKIDFDNLNAERSYSKANAYSQSKLADLMLAYELQRRLQNSGARAISLGAHPGITQSDLARNNLGLRIITKLLSPVMQTPENGAMPSVQAAIDPNVKGGEYYGPLGPLNAFGPAGKHASSPRSHDAATAVRLWQVCETISGVHFPA